MRRSSRIFVPLSLSFARESARWDVINEEAVARAFAGFGGGDGVTENLSLAVWFSYLSLKLYRVWNRNVND